MPHATARHMLGARVCVPHATARHTLGAREGGGRARNTVQHGRQVRLERKDRHNPPAFPPRARRCVRPALAGGGCQAHASMRPRPLGATDRPTVPHAGPAIGLNGPQLSRCNGRARCLASATMCPPRTDPRLPTRSIVPQSCLRTAVADATAAPGPAGTRNKRCGPRRGDPHRSP